MAFTAITTTEIDVGKPVASTLQDKIKDNFDDHEARLQVVEGGGAVTYPPIILRVSGQYSIPGAMTGILKTVTNFALTITGVRLYIDQAGSASTTQIDLKVSSGGGAYTSIFTTKPSVGFAAGNDVYSTNGVLDPTKVDLLGGDIIRLDTTGVQTGAKHFMVRIDYIKS